MTSLKKIQRRSIRNTTQHQGPSIFISLVLALIRTSQSLAPPKLITRSVLPTKTRYLKNY